MVLSGSSFSRKCKCFGFIIYRRHPVGGDWNVICEVQWSGRFSSEKDNVGWEFGCFERLTWFVLNVCAKLC